MNGLKSNVIESFPGALVQLPTMRPFTTIAGRKRPGRADDRPVGDRPLDDLLGRVPGPQADRPERAQVVLSLDGGQPPHRAGGILEARRGDALTM